MASQGEYESLREDHEALRLQFISAELDLAITFCEMAISTDSTDKAQRNATNARRAFQAASRTLEVPAPGPRYHPQIEEKLRRVKELFSELARTWRSKP